MSSYESPVFALIRPTVSSLPIARRTKRAKLIIVSISFTELVRLRSTLSTRLKAILSTI